MSDEKKYTERDLILAKREGYTHAVVLRSNVMSRVAAQWAASEYPLPKVTRPREVNDPTEPFKWAVIDGKLKAHHRVLEGGWFVPAQCGRDGGGGFVPTEARVKLWADLYANPCEEVAP